MPALPQQSSCSAGSTSSTPGDRAQQRARLVAHPLGVAEVARLLEGNAVLERSQLGRVPARERLGDVDDRQVEVRVLQVGAAAGGVGDDHLHPGLGETGGRPASELEALLAAAGVERERAAAAVVGRGDLVAVGGEHAGRRAVDLAEEHRLHAARQQADARDRRSRRRASRRAARPPRASGARAP